MNRHRGTVHGDFGRSATGRVGSGAGKGMGRSRALHIPQFGAFDFFAAVTLNFLAGDRVVDDHRVVVAADIDSLAIGYLDIALANKLLGAMAWQAVVVQVGITEAIPGRRVPGGGTDAETDADGAVPIHPGEADTGIPTAFRRQGSPTAVGRGTAPSDPGRRPVIARIPHPTEARVLVPAAVMIRCPTPRVGRVPVPTGIGPQPRSTVAIGLPARVGHGDRRTPAPAIAGDIHPAAVR